MTAHKLLEIRTDATLDGVRILRESLDRILGQSPLASEAHNGCLLGLNELACNTVRHAMPPASYLKLTVSQSDNALSFELRDDGGFFEDFASRVSLAAHAAEDEPMLLESGMGLGLIAQTLPGLTLLRSDAENDYHWVLPYSLPKARVAIIDDDPVISELLRIYLESDYEVQSFNCAHEALACLFRAPPDFVISDMNMPLMDGLALRQALLEKPQTALIPFIFVTGQQDEATQIHAHGLGVDDYLHKPVNRLELHKVVSRVLSRSKLLLQAAKAQVDVQITASLKPAVPSFAAPFNLALGSREAEVGGGDFVFHKRWGSQHTLLLGDCMGHGRQAKFFVHAYQAYLQSMLQSTQTPLAPRDLLRSLSDAMCTDGLLGASLVTCVALQWSENSPELILSLAGHPPPVVFGPQGCRTLALSGTLPGMLSGVEYPQMSLTLSPHESLLLYSDGLLEGLAPRLDPKRSQDRLHEILSDQSQMAPAELVAWLLQFGFNAQDDATALIVKRT